MLEVRAGHDTLDGKLIIGMGRKRMVAVDDVVIAAISIVTHTKRTALGLTKAVETGARAALALVGNRAVNNRHFTIQRTCGRCWDGGGLSKALVPVSVDMGLVELPPQAFIASANTARMIIVIKLRILFLHRNNYSR